MKIKQIIFFGLAGVLANAVFSETLVNFDFENHTAGSTIAALGASRNQFSGLGDGFAFTNNGSTVGYMVSALSETGPANLDKVGANVRSDTVVATVPGGKFLEISPNRLTNQNFDYVLNPNDSTVDHLRFAIQPDAGYKMSLSSFSFDIGLARGTAESAAFTFRGQGWYSLDNGSSWTQMRTVSSISNTAAQSFAGFMTINADLSGFADLQNLTGTVLMALSLSDDTGRNIYGSASTTPSAEYLDNVVLSGTVSKGKQLGLFVISQ